MILQEKDFSDEETGADVNNADDDRFTCLMRAAGSGHDQCLGVILEIIQTIMQNDVKIRKHLNIKHARSGETALICSAVKGYEKCVDLLIRAGANLDELDNYAPALNQAAENGHDKCVK